MKNIFCRFRESIFRRARAVWRQIVSGRNGGIPVHTDSPESYVGLFQGVLETTAHSVESSVPGCSPARDPVPRTRQGTRRLGFGRGPHCQR